VNLNPRPVLSLSVISHRQGALVRNLLEDLSRIGSQISMEVILTVNVPESLGFADGKWNFNLKVIKNDFVKGFGENHNVALRGANGQYFCICNPDIRIHGNPLPKLISTLAIKEIGLAAPVVLSPGGREEDSARDFPTVGRLVRKIFFNDLGRAFICNNSNYSEVEWVAGMFFVMRAVDYRVVEGFDEDYFLYYEDVDLCWRLKRLGRKVVVIRNASVVHDARRESRKKLRFFLWHAQSATRFLFKSWLATIRSRLPINDR